MTLKERMLATYRRQKTDKPPIATYSKYILRGETERMLRNYGFGIIDFLPVSTMMGPPWHMASGFMSQIKNVDVNCKYYYVNGQLRERRTYTTPVGEVYCDIGADVGIMSEHLYSTYIKDRDDYAVMKYLVENSVLSPNFGGLNARISDIGDDGVVLGRMDRTPYQKLLIEWADMENFLIDMYTDPDPALDLMDAMGRKFKEMADMAGECPAEVIWMPENVTSDMTPPSAFENYLMPYHKYLLDIARQTGKEVAFHFDGKVTALKDVITADGVKILDSFSEPCMGGDTTLEQAAEYFPDTTFCPNFPSNMAYESREKIAEYLERVLGLATKNSIMLQVSEDLPWEDWKQLMTVMAEEYNKLF